MTTQEFKTIANKKLSSIPTSDLIIEVKKLEDDFSTAANLVLEVALSILMKRLPEEKFIELCNSL